MKTLPFGRLSQTNSVDGQNSPASFTNNPNHNSNSNSANSNANQNSQNNQNQSQNVSKKPPNPNLQTRIFGQKSNDEKLLWQQIQLIYSFLQKPNSWYTGISVKKWLKKNVLTSLTNNQILANRWSAYCHFSQIQAFCNLLDKLQLNNGSQILIHPLLPDFLVQILINRGFKITSFDIDKNSLNWKIGDLAETLNSRRIDLVIFYSFNGLVEEISSAFKNLTDKVIPCLVLIDNEKLNQQTLDLFDQMTLGAVLWFGGKDCWTPFLNQTLENKIGLQNWYFSWFLENRTRSILENHLSDSQQINQKVVESFFYLLVQGWQKQSLTNYFSGLFKGILLKNKIKDDKEATVILLENWTKSLDLAVCDLVFEMELEIKKSQKRTNYLLNLKNSSGQPKAQSWQQYFASSIARRQAGSLQVPVFYTLRHYLCYFVFTTEKTFWQNFLVQNYQLQFDELFFELQPISPAITALNLPNVTFVQKYLLVMKLD